MPEKSLERSLDSDEKFICGSGKWFREVSLKDSGEALYSNVTKRLMRIVLLLLTN